MAYYSGQVASLTEIRDVLVNACLEHNGWSFSNSVLSNSLLGIYLYISVTSNGILFKGRTSLTGGDTPNGCRIGRVFQRTGYATGDIVFPAYYEIYIYEREIYLVVNHSIDIFQWLAFGKSNFDFSSSNGTGMWIAASLAETILGTSGSTTSAPFWISTTTSGGSGNNAYLAPAMFWWDSGAYRTYRQSFIHSNLDGDAWLLGLASDDAPMHRVQIPLLGRQPNGWNNESALLPVNVFKTRNSSKLSFVLQPQNCRMLRIDNYSPLQIIQLGNEKWKIYPWYQKNIAAKDGGIAIWHTGTFGWAIRYDGP